MCRGLAKFNQKCHQVVPAQASAGNAEATKQDVGPASGLTKWEAETTNARHAWRFGAEIQLCS
jgi:hypothetical protein